MQQHGSREIFADNYSVQVTKEYMDMVNDRFAKLEQENGELCARVEELETHVRFLERVCLQWKPSKLGLLKPRPIPLAQKSTPTVQIPPPTIGQD